jgi:hypothetical protein
MKKIDDFAKYMETLPEVAGTMGLPVYIWDASAKSTRSMATFVLP